MVRDAMSFVFTWPTMTIYLFAQGHIGPKGIGLGTALEVPGDIEEKGRGRVASTLVAAAWPPSFFWCLGRCSRPASSPSSAISYMHGLGLMSPNSSGSSRSSRAWHGQPGAPPGRAFLLSLPESACRCSLPSSFRPPTLGCLRTKPHVLSDSGSSI